MQMFRRNSGCKATDVSAFYQIVDLFLNQLKYATNPENNRRPPKNFRQPKVWDNSAKSLTFHVQKMSSPKSVH